MRARTAPRTAIVLLLFACSSRARSAPAEPAPAAPTVIVRLAKEGEPLLPEALEGIVIDVFPGVTYETRLVSTSEGVAEQKATIDRQPFVIDGTGELRIGAKSYGRLAAGDRVRITSDGVFRNDELLGPLPER